MFKPHRIPPWGIAIRFNRVHRAPARAHYPHGGTGPSRARGIGAKSAVWTSNKNSNGGPFVYNEARGVHAPPFCGARYSGADEAELVPDHDDEEIGGGEEEWRPDNAARVE
jgi:hypothetical protein